MTLVMAFVWGCSCCEDSRQQCVSARLCAGYACSTWQTQSLTPDFDFCPLAGALLGLPGAMGAGPGCHSHHPARSRAAPFPGTGHLPGDGHGPRLGRDVGLQGCGEMATGTTAVSLGQALTAPGG